MSVPSADTKRDERVFPRLGFPRTDLDLSFARRKPRSIAIAAAYRLLRLSRWIAGDRPVLRFLLKASWLLWRLAYEVSFEVIGPAFPNRTYCVSEDLLARWVPKGGSVVDIGCGSGRVSRLAARYAGRVVGMDRDRTRIAMAREMTRDPGVHFVVADVTAALTGERFDVALLIGVLEHIDDADGLLRSVRDIADTVIVEVPDFEADCLNLVRRDFDCGWYSDADHVREYTGSILDAQLSRNGWSAREWSQRGGMLLAVAVQERSVAGR